MPGIPLGSLELGSTILGLEALVAGASWSGKETNHLFMNDEGRRFDEVSGISGLDHVADGRVFATLDFDRDGDQDVAVLNTNEPRFLLFRNGISDGKPGGPRFVALRFEGGNRSPVASERWSARDGYGVIVDVTLGERHLVREHRCGEGLSAQNSSTLLVGLGDRDAAQGIEVRWPSGVVQRIGTVPSGTLVTVYEDPSAAPAGEAFVTSPYRPESEAIAGTAAGAASGRPAAAEAAHATAETLALAAKQVAAAATDSIPTLRLYTTTATWCAACKRELPQFEHLRSRFDPSELAMFGVPYDDDEGPAELAAYRDEFRPAYEMLTHIDAESRADIKRLLVASLPVDALPASIVTDAEGRILSTALGLPTVSELAALLENAH